MTWNPKISLVYIVKVTLYLSYYHTVYIAYMIPNITKLQTHLCAQVSWGWSSRHTHFYRSFKLELEAKNFKS